MKKSNVLRAASRSEVFATQTLGEKGDRMLVRISGLRIPEQEPELDAGVWRRTVLNGSGYFSKVGDRSKGDGH